MKMRILSLSLLLLFSLAINAQTENLTKKTPLTEQQFKRWSHLDLEKDSIPGMSVDKAYAEFLKGKKPVKVIVGVVDTGVDINHEDLKSVIWVNKKEIPNNGKDDDKNGFIDDVNGWNFLGDSNAENLEITRILKKGDDGSELYKNALAEYTLEYDETMKAIQKGESLENADNAVQQFLKKEKYTAEDLKAIDSPELENSKKLLLAYAKERGATFQTDIQTMKKAAQDKLDHYLNKDFNPRKAVGDNPDKINRKNKKYGNNVVYSKDREDSLHGTHVAGIIAQQRNNGLGGDGVADNVEIMPVRAVPDGDEYDKDIALAIRYAVDNGAKVINGSFGKKFSPHAQWVYDAIKYAESKDVLIVHSAGNDSNDIDSVKYYPSDEVDGKAFANNVLTVGALNYEYGDKLVAKFSNYGKNNVDVFSPGVKIYATVPQNGYKYLKGTSMAAPNVAGVAALIREYYPNLKAAQVKQIIMDSGTPINIDVKVGEKQAKIPFSDICVSGKIVNAYNAIKMADQLSNGPKMNPKL
ncbi:MAG: S8 family peptidase [Flavobacterium sp.]